MLRDRQRPENGLAGLLVHGISVGLKFPARADFIFEPVEWGSNLLPFQDALETKPIDVGNHGETTFHLVVDNSVSL